MAHIVLVGLNHRTAPVEVRERLAFPADKIGHALREMTGSSVIEEGVILSTCNRVELCALAEDAYLGVEAIRAFVSSHHDIPAEKLAPHLFHYVDEDAVRHLFRVASALDSMVLGEPQILGQVKDAYGYAAENGSIGPILDKFYNRAFSVAKRVRTETKIASSAVSISYAGVELAKKIFGHLEDKTVMLIGAGEMCELAAKHLVNAGVKGILVTNRTFERAVKLAEDFNGTAIRFEELTTHLRSADIILSSTGAQHFILHRAEVEEVLKIRRNRPMFFIDMAVPRDIDPAINEIDNVYVYDIDDLNNVIETNIEERQKEGALAEEIVVAEVAVFRKWLELQAVTPTIADLRRKYEEIKAGEVAKALSALGAGADEKTKKVVDAMASAILNKILHAPVAALKRERDGMSPMEFVAVVREMFDLSPPGDGTENAKGNDVDGRNGRRVGNGG